MPTWPLSNELNRGLFLNTISGFKTIWYSWLFTCNTINGNHNLFTYFSTTINLALKLSVTMHFWTALHTCWNLEIKNKNKDGLQSDALSVLTQELSSLVLKKYKSSLLTIYIFLNLFWANPRKMNMPKNSLIRQFCQICKVYFGIQLSLTKPLSILIYIIINQNKKITCL